VSEPPWRTDVGGSSIGGCPEWREIKRFVRGAAIAAKFVLDFAPPSRYARTHATRRTDRDERQRAPRDAAGRHRAAAP